LTIVLPKTDAVPAIVTAGRDSVAVRMPRHPLFRRLLKATGLPLAAPSANPFGYISPTTAAHVQQGLGQRIRYILDGGPARIGLESTIVDLTGCAAGEPPRIVRAGPITRAQLEAALGVPVYFPGQHTVAVPGNVAVHYRPGTPLHMFDTATLRAQLNALPDDARIALAHTSDDLPTSRGVIATLDGQVAASA
jgi:L-threonylcarbamoyladenylate synthase